MKRDSYNHSEIEPALQKKWEEEGIYATNLNNDEKEKYYLLFEFPYPSGDLHIGHWYAFALTDIFARKLRMESRNVLFPVGFDAFGLPAENAAIKRGADPREWTYQNMETMRTQMKTMGTSVDWSKEVVSCDPSYYKWTQWLFTKFFEHNLAERKLAPVKWCPKDKTVLANEQVKDGSCERCGTEVEDKNLTQWFLKITNYADRLLSDLDALDWPSEIKEAQRAWIGKSEGATIDFSLQTAKESSPSEAVVPSISVFTTRPDTVYGATYLVLAPEHPLIDTLMQYTTNADEVQKYRREAGKKTERERSENKEKTGVALSGITAVNPATMEHIPVYIADYVLATYGTGAVMAVPAHDERDFEFAKKYSLPTKTVIGGADKSICYTGDGFLENSGEFNGRNNREVMNDIITAIGAEKVSNYRLRDWSVGRQRYWGCPIPVVYDPEGKPHPVPAEHLPWLLPEDVSLQDSTENGLSPLARSKELQERVTRIFGEGWTPEYDTLDTFVDSSWYFMRYLDAENEHEFTDLSLAKKWMPVDRYSGGSEHTTMHLLYARFFTKVLYDLALSPVSEPFKRRLNRGIILGPDGNKMSKSKGNVINPDEVVEKYGADAVRMYLAFIGPYNEAGHYPWNLDGAFSMRKFLDRIYELSKKVSISANETESLRKAESKTIKKVSDDVNRFKYNTAISALMVYVRELEALEEIPRKEFCTLLRLLAPFAPHLTDHIWGTLKESGSVHTAPWPIATEEHLTDEEVVIVVQVSGKRRGELTISREASETDVLEKALKEESIKKFVGSLPPIRTIYVQGRLINIIPSPI